MHRLAIALVALALLTGCAPMDYRYGPGYGYDQGYGYNGGNGGDNGGYYNGGGNGGYYNGGDNGGCVCKPYRGY